jgi:hypothetical protein
MQARLVALLLIFNATIRTVARQRLPTRERAVPRGGCSTMLALTPY